mmetsp:Transcript_47317/g.112460  ORF Transcript_47317/g.112460 Transcript_47317/m.112460 type:complete len:210 (-) Transcript_47317:392-1021(-)
MAHQDVGALDISVEHRGILSMQVRQALQQVSGISRGQALLEGSELLQHTGHGAADHVLHVDEETFVNVVMPQVRHDAGMLQLGADLDLVLQGVLELHIRSVRGVNQDLLDREELAAPLVQGLEDVAQGAPTQILSPHPCHRAPHCRGRAHSAQQLTLLQRRGQHTVRHAEAGDALEAASAGGSVPGGGWRLLVREVVAVAKLPASYGDV